MHPTSEAFLADWIRDGRKRVRWTQTELGRYLGVTQAAVSHWETGKASPGDAEFQAMPGSARRCS